MPEMAKWIGERVGGLIRSPDVGKMDGFRFHGGLLASKFPAVKDL